MSTTATESVTTAPPADPSDADMLRAAISRALEALALVETGRSFPGGRDPLSVLAAVLEDAIGYWRDHGDDCTCEPGRPCCGDHAADDRLADDYTRALSLLKPESVGTVHAGGGR